MAASLVFLADLLPTHSFEWVKDSAFHKLLEVERLDRPHDPRLLALAVNAAALELGFAMANDEEKLFIRTECLKRAMDHFQEFTMGSPESWHDALNALKDFYKHQN